MEIFLAHPHGFCAGVRRALEIVKQAISDFGAPIYVRHEIVHNKHVVEDLKKEGVIFIDELSEIKDLSRPVIFSAHGVPIKIQEQAKNTGLNIIDATCPLVTAVHNKIKKLEAQNAEIIVIGKATHPEILGTIGQLQNPKRAHIISSIDEAAKLNFAQTTPVGVVTQTTLSVDDTQEIATALKNKYSRIINGNQLNVCFATTNRQKAVKELCRHSPNIIIIGSKNSSNSTHLAETALRQGAKQVWLIDDYKDLDLSEIKATDILGISAGASAPDYLLDELLAFLRKHYDNINIHDVTVVREDISFK